MPAFLALIPTKDWIYGGLIVALLLFGMYERHHLLVEGQQHELAMLQASAKKLQVETDKQTAELKAKATMAEQAYAKEILALTNRAPVQSVRLCLDTYTHPVVPHNVGTDARNATISATTANIQPVPSRDNSGGERTAGPDISDLLGLLALQGDISDAALREFQSR